MCRPIRSQLTCSERRVPISFALSAYSGFLGSKFKFRLAARRLGPRSTEARSQSQRGCPGSTFRFRLAAQQARSQRGVAGVMTPLPFGV